MNGLSALARARLAAAAGVCASALWLSLFAKVLAPWHLIGFVALVPFFWALERLDGIRPSLVAGAAMASGYVLATQTFFAEAVHRYVGISGGATVALLALAGPLLAPQFPIAALGFALVRRRGYGPGAAFVGGALGLLGAEWAIPRVLEDALGYGLAPSLLLRQVAELGGVRLLSLLVLAGNGGVLAASRLRTSRSPVDLRLTVGAAVLVAGALVYGQVRSTAVAREVSAGRAVRIGVVQANLTHYAELAEKLGTYDAVVSILDAHERLSAKLLAQGPLDAVIWPETVYPTTFGAPQSEEGAELDARIVAAVARWKVPLVFGAYEREEGAEFNAAVFLSPGQQPAFYRKAHLFPLTEHVPAAIDGARFRGWFPWTGTWTAGNGPRALSLMPASGAPLRVAPLICYDVVHSDGVAAAARLEPDLLVNLSNDSWFGGTVGARVHLAIAAIRSVETRLPQVRSTNSGISAAIDPLGEISAQTPDGEEAVLTAELRAAHLGPTLFTRTGDRLGPLAVILWVGLVSALAFRRAGASALSSPTPSAVR